MTETDPPKDDPKTGMDSDPPLPPPQEDSAQQARATERLEAIAAVRRAEQEAAAARQRIRALDAQAGPSAPPLDSDLGRGRSRTRSDGQRSTRASSVASVDFDPAAASDEAGLARSLRAAYAANQVNMFPEDYDQRVRLRISRDVGRQANPARVQRNLKADIDTHLAAFRQDLTAELRRFTYDDHFLETRPRLTTLDAQGTSMDHRQLEAFYDQLAPFPRFSSQQVRGLLDFLETFVGAVNDHEVNLATATTRFLAQFEGTLKRELQADINGSSLQAAIDRLFQLKCERETRHELKTAIDQFTFTGDNLRGQIYDFQGKLRRFYPVDTRDFLDHLTRVKVESQLTPEGLHALNTENAAFHASTGHDMEFLRWLHTIETQKLPFQRRVGVKQVLSTPHPQGAALPHPTAGPPGGARPEDPPSWAKELSRSVKELTQTLPKAISSAVQPPQTEARFQQGYLQGLQDRSSVLSVQQSSSAFPPPQQPQPPPLAMQGGLPASSHLGQPSGEAPHGRTAPPRPQERTARRVNFLTPTDPKYQAALQKFKDPSVLISNKGYYPDNSQSQLPYRWAGNFFVPEEPVDQVPSTAPFVELENGRCALNASVRRHFEERCASCGMKGHTAAHRQCPLRDSDSTWDLCSKCGCGFHTVCRIHPDSINRARSFLA